MTRNLQILCKKVRQILLRMHNPILQNIELICRQKIQDIKKRTWYRTNVTEGNRAHKAGYLPERYQKIEAFYSDDRCQLIILKNKSYPQIKDNDILDEEWVKFQKVLNVNQLKFIMAGGFATRFDEFNGNTDDLEWWPVKSL